MYYNFLIAFILLAGFFIKRLINSACPHVLRNFIALEIDNSSYWSHDGSYLQVFKVLY